MAVPDIPGLNEAALASGLASIGRLLPTSMAIADRLALIEHSGRIEP